MPRKRKQPTPKAKPEARPRGPQPGKQQRSKTKAKGTTKRPPKRLTVGQIVARNQQVVLDRDIDFLTWPQIAKKHKVTEKAAREGYLAYVNEIAPLIESEDAHDKALEFIRKHEGVQERVAKIAANEKVAVQTRLSALSKLVDIMWREIELRQALGMMPKHLGQLTIITEVRWVAEQVILLLKKYEAPPAAMQELHEIMSGARSN